jgi:hypothetical protein
MSCKCGDAGTLQTETAIVVPLSQMELAGDPGEVLPTPRVQSTSVQPDFQGLFHTGNYVYEHAGNPRLLWLRHRKEPSRFEPTSSWLSNERVSCQANGAVLLHRRLVRFHREGFNRTHQLSKMSESPALAELVRVGCLVEAP